MYRETIRDVQAFFQESSFALSDESLDVEKGKL
jgi:hypothetical protein